MAEVSSKLAKKAADQGIAVEVAAALAAVGGDLFAITQQNASVPHKEKAVIIQAASRGRLARKDLGEQHSAARRIQAISRGFLTRSNTTPGLTAGLQKSPSRPGFEWMLQQMPAADRAAERAQRFRNAISFDRRRARPMDSSVPTVAPVHVHVDTLDVFWRYSGADPAQLQQQASAARIQRAQSALPAASPPRDVAVRFSWKEVDAKVARAKKERAKKKKSASFAIPATYPPAARGEYDISVTAVEGGGGD